MTDTDPWVHLALVKGMGPKTCQHILNQGLSAQQIYEMDHQALRDLNIPNNVADTIIKHPPSNPSVDAEQALSWCQQPHHHLLTWHHDFYPQRLKHIAAPPPLLMVRGRPDYLSLPQIALVGSRYPTQAGQTQAFEFAESLADMGFVVTSGLARGVDSFAHKGALQSGGATIAVLGTGLNQIYPKQNKRLADEISEKGAVISEFSLSSVAQAGHFPRRNRIVSGLSLGVLVVEATLKSGSLITARQALEQNREVMALPGSLANPQKAGCHYLIRQGAQLIETAEQILETFGAQVIPNKPVIRVKGAAGGSNDLPEGIEPEQASILKKLDYDGMAIDELAARTQVPIHELTVTLMDLELSGLIRQEQGLFARV